MDYAHASAIPGTCIPRFYRKLKLFLVFESNLENMTLNSISLQ